MHRIGCDRLVVACVGHRVEHCPHQGCDNPRVDERTRSQGPRDAAHVVLVTGGGSGIGAAIAQAAAQAGSTVVVAGRRHQSLQRVAATNPGHIHAIQADLAQPAQVEHLVEMTVRDHGRLDGVVANAGVMVTGTVAETTAEDWQQALDVNLTSTFLLAKHSIPHLRRSRGAFVAVGSIAGVRAPRGAAAYAISKSAIGMLVAAIAVEEGPNGVRANCVHPGWVRTEMADAEMDEFGSQIGQDRDEAYATVTALVPQRRPADPHEIAGTVLWLLGPQAGYVNGASIVADGGTTMVDPGTAAFDFTVTPRG